LAKPNQRRNGERIWEGKATHDPDQGKKRKGKRSTAAPATGKGDTENPIPIKGKERNPSTKTQ